MDWNIIERRWGYLLYYILEIYAEFGEPAGLWEGREAEAIAKDECCLVTTAAFVHL